MLVALSGGSDSLALTLLLRDLADLGGFAVVALAHLNHGLRPEAQRDEAFCRAFAAGLDLPVLVEGADVASAARQRGWSIEDAARRIRYDFLSRAAASVRADRIAIGHTRDDQAETLLLKVIRGAGLTGMGGIAPRRGVVIRPLLECSKEQLQVWLRTRGQLWVEDESNAEPGAARNRIRHSVLPALDEAGGGDVRPALARAAMLLREDGEWLDLVADRRFAELADGGAVPRCPARTPPDWPSRTPPCAPAAEMWFDMAALTAEPLPIRRRIVLQALRVQGGGREIGLDHVTAALAVLAGDRRAADVPGTRVELRDEKLVLLNQEPRSKC